MHVEEVEHEAAAAVAFHQSQLHAGACALWPTSISLSQRFLRELTLSQAALDET